MIILKTEGFKLTSVSPLLLLVKLCVCVSWDSILYLIYVRL